MTVPHGCSSSASGALRSYVLLILKIEYITCLLIDRTALCSSCPNTIATGGNTNATGLS